MVPLWLSESPNGVFLVTELYRVFVEKKEVEHPFASGFSRQNRRRRRWRRRRRRRRRREPGDLLRLHNFFFMAGRKLRCRTVNDDAEDRNRMWTHIYSKKKESNRFLQLTGFFFVSFETGGLLPSFFCSADLSSSRTWSYEDRNRMGTRIYLKKEKRVQLISAVQPTFYRVELGLVEFRVEWEGVDDVESHPRAGWLFGGSRWEPKWPSACLGKAAACAAAALFSFWPRLRGRRRPPGSCDAGRRRSVIYGPAGRVSLSLSLSVCVFACVFACVCVWLRSQHSNQAGSRPLFTQYGRYGAVLSWFRICFFFVFYVLSMETFCSFRLEPRTAVLWAIFCSIKSLISIPAFRVGCRWGPCHFYRKFLTFLLIFGKKKNKKWSPFDLTFFKMDAFDAECPEGLPSSVCFFLILFLFLLPGVISLSFDQ